MSLVKIVRIALFVLSATLALPGMLSPASAQSGDVQLRMNNTIGQKVDVYVANRDGSEPRPLVVLQPGSSKTFRVPAGRLVIFGMNRKPFQRYLTTQRATQDVEIVFGGASATGSAGDDQASTAGSPGSRCADAGSTAQMNACEDAIQAEADAELNAVYKQALNAIASTRAQPPYDAKSFEAAFRASQRAWLVWRDAECKDVVPMFSPGGTITTSAVLGCLSEKTKARSQEIQQRFAPN
jgi:uncharacterized protein YecT (DUF1311 family)